jgi:hypothetical protein
MPNMDNVARNPQGGRRRRRRAPGAKALLDWLLKEIYDLFIGWIVGLANVIEQWCERRKHRERLQEDGRRYTRCQVIPPEVYKRPDPLIYSQAYLLAQGLAVTWDNPDIQLFSIGPPLTPISSNDLKANTEYEIQATVLNGSTSAPAIGLPVEFSFLTFGIGTTSTPIGADKVDLQVKGLPPSVAKVRWRTPVVAGHYCIQVRLVWADDANPNNNLGQENVNVALAHSPATFTFETHNGSRTDQRVRLTTDAYTLPAPMDCAEVTAMTDMEFTARTGSKEDQQKDERLRWCAAIASRHQPQLHPIPDGWRVDVVPDLFPLAPGASQIVTVTVTPPDSFSGTQAVNVNGFDQNGVALGGVTLYTRR